MKKINTIIIDDNVTTREELKVYLSYFSFVSCKGTFNDYIEGKNILDKKDIDLIFLKINPNNNHYIDIANNISLIHKHVQIVFLSSDSKHAHKSFEAHPFDYLIQPIEPIKLEKCLLHFKYRWKNKFDLNNLKNRKICIKKGNSLYFLEIDKITTVEYRDRKININLNDKETLSYSGSLKDLEKKLYSYGFILVSRSLLISLKSIKSIVFDEYNKCYILKSNSNNSIKITPEKYKKIKQILIDFNWII
ncbi:LytTR family DNA-binding domain-containing protein [Staphylococcus sp. SQ8-PEA]|uniref:LytTR family DNA-binding domain-containing protein n=2 Tax=Staphylococcus marylandisciuri TaxID=2981529 RepID=A0ABT2QR85_9STAP|nr:LytTR family DNA-binding domain-containing protein [Staphylococcus marylandisciuri]